MATLDLGGPLVHGTPQFLVPGPTQQERRSYRVAQFLKCQRERITIALAIDTREHRGGRELAAVDRDGESHEIRMVFLDLAPVDRPVEQMRNRFQGLIATRVVEPEVLPAPNSRHQFDSQQVSERKDVRRLAVRVRVYLGGPQVRQFIVQNIENVSGLVDSVADEAAEQSNVVVGDVPIGNAAGFAIAEVARCQQIIAKGLKMGAISGSRFASAP